MSLTKVETTNATRALVVVDPQLEYFRGPLKIAYPPVAYSLARILDAISVAARTGIPIAVVQHKNPSGAAAFAQDSPSADLHPAVVERLATVDKSLLHFVTKRFASVFDETDLPQQLATWGVNTVTLVGYMTNNCILASASGAAPLGLAAEVLSDATGSINLANDVGSASARIVQETLLTLLNSNFAAVADTAAWIQAVSANKPLPKSNLIESAQQSDSGVDWVPDGADPKVIEGFWRAVRGQLGNHELTGGDEQSTFDEVPEAWAFGDDPQLADELLALVLSGTKTGTASALWDFEDGEPIPRPGDLSIILDGAGQPRAVIQTTAIDVVPFNEVTAEHAYSEGEGDRTLASWRRDHESFYRRSYLGGREFSETMPIVAERFELLFPIRRNP